MSGHWTKFKLDGERVKPMLHETMPIGDGETPDVWGWRDRANNIRRVFADYPNGWRLTLNFTKPKNGSVTVSSYKASLHMEIPAKGAST